MSGVAVFPMVKHAELSLMIMYFVILFFRFNPFTPRLNHPAQVPQPRFFSGHLISNAWS
jgi:hypothetical protein